MRPACTIAHRGTIGVPDTPEAMPQVIVGTHRRRWIITDAMRSTMGFKGKVIPNPGEKARLSEKLARLMKR